MKFILITSILLLSLSACNKWKGYDDKRSDNAKILDIDLKGSLQNPSFSPDGTKIVFTRFKKGYYKGKADLFVYTFATGNLRELVIDNGANINLPGSTWSPVTNQITFSSERDTHDEIFIIDANGVNGDEIQLSSRTDRQSFEPSFSPNGDWVMFESHPIDVEKEGVITKYKVDGSSDYIELSNSSENLKQPNWSPVGDKILYQKQTGEQWDLWVMDIDGENKTKITSNGESTDAAFTSDGEWIIYSSGGEGVEIANIFKINITTKERIRLTTSGAYDGAPSISADGTKVCFESYPGEPNKSKGTKLVIINL